MNIGKEHGSTDDRAFAVDREAAQATARAAEGRPEHQSRIATGAPGADEWDNWKSMRDVV